jgi:membrane protease YdiL (CAAX protease family)
MTVLPTPSPNENKQLHDRIALLLLLGLLIIRLPFVAGVAFFISPKPDWLSPIFEISTYFLTVCLVWWERKRLAEFHIDTFVIAIIIFFKPIETLILAAMVNNDTTQEPLAFPSIPALIIWIVAIGLLLAFLWEKPRLPRIQGKTIAWFIVGTLVGILTAILLAYPLSLQIANGEHLSSLPPYNLNDILINGFFLQIGFAAVSEEPLFRGFLWGYLRKAGWREPWIWLFQAGLFWIGHIYYFGKLLISFWIAIPIGGLVLGGLAWRSRSIATSIAAHAAMNGLGFILAYITFFYFQ